MWLRSALGPLAALALAGCGTPSPSTGPVGGETQGLHVSGNHLADGSGRAVRLLGVDRSGAEFRCVQNNGIFDGPVDAASIEAMKAWRINAVRIPLNEDCWLGINGVQPAYGGSPYRDAIESYVIRLHAAGLAVILDLHWTAPGGVEAETQMPMPDADHSPAMWSSVASAFKNDDQMIFDLFNEPFPDSAGLSPAAARACWRAGCTMNAGWGASTSWQAAGMQSLIDAVRSSGAIQPLMIGGLRWSNDLSGWVGALHDPLSQLVASFHVYNFNSCVDEACWSQQLATIARSAPVVSGEIGENDCAGGFIDRYMRWADSVGISYLGWTWNTWNCNSGPALISDYDGTPTAYGQAFRAHLATVA